MNKQALFVLLCAALAACNTGDAPDHADVATDQSQAAIVAPQSVVSFFASAGNAVVLRVVDTGHTAAIPSLTVNDPSGAKVVSAWSGDVAAAAFQATATGMFSVAISDVSSAQPAGVVFTLYLAIVPGANTGGALSPGGVVAGHLDEGELDSYTFTAAAGEGIILRLTDLAGGGLVPGFTIYGPTGNVIRSAWSGDVASWAFAAPSTGTYTVIAVDASSTSASTGDYKLYYTKAPGANTGGALSRSGPVLQHIDEGELDSYTFTALASESLLVRVTDRTAGALVPGFTIYDPAGRVVRSVWSGDVASWSFIAALTGTYTVVVYDASSTSAATGDYEIVLLDNRT